MITHAYYVLAGAYILLTLLTDTRFFTGILIYFEYISIAMILYIIICLMLNLKAGGVGNFLSFFGILILCLTAVNDILYYRGIWIIDPVAGHYFLTPVGMTFFVFCNALVVSVEYVDTETALMDERRQSDALTESNAALDRINRMKTEMIAVVTHETMTPLAVLSGYAELVARELRRKGVDEQTAKDLDNIAEETQRISWLMDELQSHARKQDSRISRTRLALTELIDGAARLYKPILERKKITLDIHIPKELPDVYGCASEITQVLFNLLQNARNHTENGKVTITVAAEKEYIVIDVADTGSGILPELLPLVFEHGVSGTASGTGLGLYICREIIDRHNGVIEIKSEQNKGTTVRFTLPVWTEGLKLG